MAGNCTHNSLFFTRALAAAKTPAERRFIEAKQLVTCNFYKYATGHRDYQPRQKAIVEALLETRELAEQENNLRVKWEAGCLLAKVLLNAFCRDDDSGKINDIVGSIGLDGLNHLIKDELLPANLASFFAQESDTMARKKFAVAGGRRKTELHRRIELLNGNELTSEEWRAIRIKYTPDFILESRKRSREESHRCIDDAENIERQLEVRGQQSQRPAEPG